MSIFSPIWHSIVLFLFWPSTKRQKQTSEIEEQLKDKTGIMAWLKKDTDKALEHIHAMGQEAITNRNSALSQRRNLYLTIFLTSGTFLTVALPLLNSVGSSLTSSNVFKIITLILLSALIIGIVASLSEWSFEARSADYVRNNVERAYLCLLHGNYNDCADLIIGNSDKQRLLISVWELVCIVTLRNVAFLLFIIGVFALTILILFQPSWLLLL